MGRSLRIRISLSVWLLPCAIGHLTVVEKPILSQESWAIWASEGHSPAVLTESDGEFHHGDGRRQAGRWDCDCSPDAKSATKTANKVVKTSEACPTMVASIFPVTFR